MTIMLLIWHVRPTSTREAIRRGYISSHVFTSVVHALICPWIDYCNSPLVCFPNVCLFSLQTILNAAARQTARLPRISAFMFDHFLSLNLIAPIQLKVLISIYWFPSVYVILSTCSCSPPLSFVCCAHFTGGMIPFSLEQGLLWLKQKPLPLEPTPPFDTLLLINWWGLLHWKHLWLVCTVRGGAI